MWTTDSRHLKLQLYGANVHTCYTTELRYDCLLHIYTQLNTDYRNSTQKHVIMLLQYNIMFFSLFSVSRRSLDLQRVRATDPRPCPKCGKIYRSAHTLRTHLEDKHTICPGYRCVLCGTVAKSRNSLHSHMSRQHRGISTKDLPVLPMPAPFDPDLASRYV